MLGGGILPDRAGYVRNRMTLDVNVDRKRGQREVFDRNECGGLHGRGPSDGVAGGCAVIDVFRTVT